MSDRVDTVVIGAGVVGLAVARSIAASGREVLMLERHRRPAQETTSRNSGVIHSGIYYPSGSLKARLCVRGREMLLAYCRERGVEFQLCGKLIVAQPGQEGALATLMQRAHANGVTELRQLDAGQVRGLEPAVRCAGALFSPGTGIVDVHELVDALEGDIQSHGGAVACGATVSGVDLAGDDITVEVISGGDATRLHCRTLVNAAGLEAVGLLARMRGYPAGLLRTAFYAKGNYFVLRSGRPFRHLVYPMPDEAGLGVHATLDLDGAVRFGPDVQWVPSPEYAVDERRAGAFEDSIRAYWPGLPEGALVPGYAGVRPKLVGPGASAADFVVETAATHGREGLVNLLGIESPGLTSALALGEYVAQQC